MTYTPGKVAGISRIGKVKLPSYFMLALPSSAQPTPSMLLMEISRVRHCGAPSSTDATLSSTARIRASLGCRCHTSALSITCSCLDWQRALLTIRSRTVCASAQFFMPRWAPLLRCTLCTFRSALFAKFVVIASSLP